MLAHLALALGFLSAAYAAPVSEPVIELGDVALFYRVYDAAAGRPSAEQLQRDYLDAGSAGLRVLARARNVTGARIAEAIARRPEIYARARDCASVLPRVRERVAQSMRRLSEIYPPARFPPITIAIGRGRPVAIGHPVTGVQIGLEALCAADFIDPDIEDRFVHLIAHEYAHVQQAPELAAVENPTVLEASLIEGSAEFVAELISGSVGYTYFPAIVEGREQEIETRFAADVDKRDLSDWLYNSTFEQPRDLGYWVGYRIARSYYERAADKGRAVREILEMRDARAFLAASGWRPGAARGSARPDRR
jgi:hypothetical protein